MIFENVRNVFLFISLNLSFFPVSARQIFPESPGFNQVVITEIMADPVPQILLPQYEYIEILNRSNSHYYMKDCKLQIGVHTIALPSIVIGSGEYVIICDLEADSLFSTSGFTLPVNLPSILNTGQVITLQDSSGNVIHSVKFTDHWYGSPDMAGGGRSLEIIDPDNPCGSDINWSVSADPRGGTPGKINSVMGDNPDFHSPLLLRATVPDDSTVILHFSEALNPGSVSNTMIFSVNQNLLHPYQILPLGPDFSRILLSYHTSFKPDYIYTVTVLQSPSDCAGNQLAGNAYADFALSELPEVSDIIINEILFNASSDGVEFIELYNQSDRPVDISNMAVSLADHSGVLKKTLFLKEHPFLLLSQKYVVLTNDSRKLIRNHPLSHPGNIVEAEDMFTLPDTEGLIVLADTTGHIIDECLYSYRMHHDLLEDVEGVSLERVNPGNPSGDPGNWHSASTTAAYATPGMPNSQMTTADNEWNINLSSEIMSPDNDGVDDFVTLHLQSGESGWTGTVAIYTPEGIRIKSLLTNSILGTEEYLMWDGSLQDGSSAEIGLYLFYGELYSVRGKTKKFKKVIALVRK